MLVLSRRIGERIIAGNIEFEIVEVRQGKVRVGISAPDDVKILRHEVEARAKHPKPPVTREVA